MKHQDQHFIQQVNHDSSNNRGFKNDPCRPIRSLDSASLHHLIQTQTLVQTVQILLSIKTFRAAGIRWERCEEEKCEGDGLERRHQPSVLGDFGLTAVISWSAKTTAPSRKLLSLIQVLDGRIHLDPPQAADARELDFQWPPVSSCDERTLFLFFGTSPLPLLHRRLFSAFPRHSKTDLTFYAVMIRAGNNSGQPVRSFLSSLGRKREAGCFHNPALCFQPVSLVVKLFIKRLNHTVSAALCSRRPAMTGLIDFLGRLQRKDTTLLLLTALSVQPLMLPEAWQPAWFSYDSQSQFLGLLVVLDGWVKLWAHHSAFQSAKTELDVAWGLFIHFYMH